MARHDEPDAPPDAGAPLDLGVVGSGGLEPTLPSAPSAASSASSGAARRAGWRRWSLPAAALGVGVLLGVVISDARDTTESYARVDVVGGPIETVVAQPDARMSSTLAVNLLNDGPRAIEILRVEADGFGIPADAPAPSAVTAAPGGWVRFTQTELRADCHALMPIESELRVRVRAESGDEEVVAVTPPDDTELMHFWQGQCDLTGFIDVSFGEPRSVIPGDTATTFTLSLINGSRQDSRVSTLVPDSPGLQVTSPDLPRVIPAGETVLVEVTWIVDDCVAAQDLGGVTVVFDVATETLDQERTQELGKRVLVELARLTERACGL